MHMWSVVTEIILHSTINIHIISFYVLYLFVPNNKNLTNTLVIVVVVVLTITAEEKRKRSLFREDQKNKQICMHAVVSLLPKRTTCFFIPIGNGKL